MLDMEVETDVETEVENEGNAVVRAAQAWQSTEDRAHLRTP